MHDEIDEEKRNIIFVRSSKSKSKTPRWFIEIENKLIKDKNTRVIFSSYEINKYIYDELRNKRYVQNGWSLFHTVDNELDELLIIDKRFN
ncbi:hypothetical protein GLOIN_2v1763570 [Rhizophagus irregularis DAOM 181602=DAOM 197198]|uniref:Uncharacterized protein n=1 Tax=Rhizophagus irregularis (strain DAOM 181602 / DAOM 197198 / MUCL 43194) TaxID=747089 RepID=A0A2P4QUK4_RHIID|nr:hypothetical protein GLOIN_2v1763570 [Rhizophagus irregularis DAOM 181602=DAOM 197198]POG81321.1 hypothetical protein GLOIN_2v1763570 [Rhizophagus irregularis DAOM 181602=DAOM 197198]GET51607.1 hypothetical protein GLOIN_2v1763570 [Rhizophagus irregularis DAOM 181602=DAOM 197198]CAG8727787.1 15253_t:CDS:2 [Rhizophagus irregularis]|eukprot:XP_025188187.1 hypothetical protein GLOIN_2v1763570 [Rhizophagus irregularis DAOM 181602=DAOM 197198]